MQKINLLKRREFDLNLLKNTIAAGREKNRQRQFEWGILIFDEFLYIINIINTQPSKEERLIVRKMLDNLGDSYYALTRYDAAFACYLHSFMLGAASVLQKLILLTQSRGDRLTQENAILGFFLLIANREASANADLIKNLEPLLPSLSPELQFYADIFLAHRMTESSVFEDMANSELKLNILIEKYGLDAINKAYYWSISSPTPRALSEFLKVKSKESLARLLSTDFLHRTNAEIYGNFRSSDQAPSLLRYKCTEANFWRKINPSILSRTLGENINYKILLLRFASRLWCHPTTRGAFERDISNDWICLESFDHKKYDSLFSNGSNNKNAIRVFRQLPSA
jgi:hypothetical protein